MSLFGSNKEKKVVVTDTKWGKSYTISTMHLTDEIARVVIEFPDRGTKFMSTKVYKEDEIGEPIAWLQEYTKDNDLYPILGKFKKVIENTPFDK